MTEAPDDNLDHYAVSLYTLAHALLDVRRNRPVIVTDLLADDTSTKDRWILFQRFLSKVEESITLF